jgi:hypothetical protein
MPTISLCKNTDCPLRDNCERALEPTDNMPNQMYKMFYPVKQSLNTGTGFIWACYYQLKINHGK